MCGICGELRLDGQAAQPAIIDKMLSKLVHRGPDSDGRFFQEALSFGHRRLSIIDLSAASNQPFVDQTAGLALVFNGTIYNYRELRTELTDLGHRFTSEGDTEVILRAYAQWGEQCVPRLHGMFAFAIWDTRRQQLFMARDRFGIKPFYYSLSDNAFRFASSTQALLSAGDVDTRFDACALHHHFTLHAVVPAPHTVFVGIRKLPPAHSMTIKASGEQIIKPYWELNSQASHSGWSEAQWVEAVHDSLRSAVYKRRQIADVPVGVLLSGGLDSSLLVALLAEHGTNGLRTFSIGFEDHPDEKGDEFEFSDQIVERYGTVHQKLLISNNDVLKRLPEAVSFMTEPMAAQDAVAFFLLSERVSEYVKVVQSGQGADEVFGGYFWYPKMHQASGSDLDRFRYFYFDRDHDEYLRMIKSAYHCGDATAELVAQRLEMAKGEDYLNRVLNFDVTTLIVDDPVKRVDNMTMAWGLEARVPFLDHELVELVAGMPVDYKIGSDGKHILKKVARGLVPDAVIDRTKAYFPVPALKYVRGEVLDFVRDILNSQACRERGLYQRNYIESLFLDPEKNLTRLQGNKLWHLAVLELWLQVNLDGISH
ncbi:MAG: N-acetylglutaminylglutamine amidotransferase [Gammaproteobacteria bacterium]